MEIPEHLKKWRLNASKQQQTFYSLLGDREWDELDRNQKDFKNNLKIKVSMALFAKTFTKCTSTQQTKIDATVETLLQLCGSGNVVLVGYTYVHIFTETQQESILPLIRVKSKYDSKSTYFEIQPGKIYDSWDTFLSSNNIQEAYLCYPKKGYYAYQSDKLVHLEFGKSSNETGGNSSVNDCPVPIFFPFFKTLNKSEIVVGTKLTHILTSKFTITEDPLDVINDKNHIAAWLRSIIKEIGSVGIETDTTTSVILESNVYFAAVRLFRSIYNTSCKVNTSKFIISLMTVILKQKIDKCKADDYFDFLAGMVFFLNITADITFVKEIVVKLNEKPLEIQNFFTAARDHKLIKKLTLTGFSFKPAKKSKCDRNVYGICYILKQIYDMERNPISNPDTVSVKIVNYVKSVKSALKNDSEEFWISFNKTLYPIFTEYLHEVSKDNLVGQTWLKSKWSKIGFPKKNVFDAYFNDSLPSVVRRMFRSLMAIDQNMPRREALQARLLAYSLELSRTMYCQNSEQFFDILSMVMEKFISWYDSMAVGLKSKYDDLSQNDRESIIGKIFVKLNEPSVIMQFKEDFEELYEMNREPYLGEPAFSFNGVELYYFCVSPPSSLDPLNIDDDDVIEQVAVEFTIKAFHHLLQISRQPRGTFSVARFIGVLRSTHKSTMALAYHRKQAGKIFGFFIKIHD